MKLGFIGTGNLASAILRGVVSCKKIAPSEIFIYDINQAKVNELCEELSVNAADSASEIAANCGCVIIAVKPKDFTSLANEIKSEIRINKIYSWVIVDKG